MYANKVNKAFTLMEILIVTVTISIVSAIAIPNLLRAKMSANEAAAQAALRTISTACETFAVDNAGEYPSDETDLTGSHPAYLNRNYDGQTLQGYTYVYTDLDGSQYTVTATATPCGTMGNHNYQITIGGVLTAVACE
jgi:prepilin-type N-terminal cleavage/methylation domain-containing protein